MNFDAAEYPDVTRRSIHYRRISFVFFFCAAVATVVGLASTIAADDYFWQVVNAVLLWVDVNGMAVQYFACRKLAR